jgi:hypothetical protein
VCYAPVVSFDIVDVIIEAGDGAIGDSDVIMSLRIDAVDTLIMSGGVVNCMPRTVEHDVVCAYEKRSRAATKVSGHDDAACERVTAVALGSATTGIGTDAIKKEDQRERKHQ